MQPALAENVTHAYGARDRRLNPAEYPSLSAAAYAAQQHQTKQQQQYVASGQVLANNSALPTVDPRLKYSKNG